MKIIIPNICYEDNFEDNVSYTLRKMGHEVLTMPRQARVLNDKARHILQQVESRLFPNRFSLQEKWLMKVYKEFKPDIVLCLTQALNEEVLLELKTRSIITICWWGDTAANMQKQGLLCYGWDFVFIKDRFAVQKLRSLDINAYHLHEATNPDWHKWNFTEINSAIVFAGNTYDYRHFLLRKLIKEGKYDIQLYGNKPPRWASLEINQIFQNKYVVKEVKSKIFGSALACINSTSMTEFDSLNCRAFEIAGAGGLQIMEYRPAIEECFIPEKEILTFKTFDELKERIHFLNHYEKESFKIRQESQKRSLNDHTYNVRLSRILNYI